MYYRGYHLLFVSLQSITSFYNIMQNETNNMPANRIKAVLAEQRRSARWLATEIGKNETTISRWCSNKIQPSIPQLQEIARLLNVDVRELLFSTKKRKDV